MYIIHILSVGLRKVHPPQHECNEHRAEAIDGQTTADAQYIHNTKLVYKRKLLKLVQHVNLLKINKKTKVLC